MHCVNTLEYPIFDFLFSLACFLRTLCAGAFLGWFLDDDNGQVPTGDGVSRSSFVVPRIGWLVFGAQQALGRWHRSSHLRFLATARASIGGAQAEEDPEGKKYKAYGLDSTLIKS
jgi:hypothetical protein